MLLSDPLKDEVPLFPVDLISIKKAFTVENGDDESITNMMIGITLLASGASKPAVEALQQVKDLLPKDAVGVAPLIDVLIDFGEAITSAKNLDYIDAIDHLSKGKAKLKKTLEVVPDAMKKMLEYSFVTSDILIIIAIAERSELLGDYNTAASKREEACKIMNDIIPIVNSLYGLSYAKFWSGQYLMTSGLGKVDRSRYLANSGLIEEAIQLCEQAKNDLNKSDVEFLESDYPQSEDNRKKVLQYVHVIIPSIISNFKNGILLQEEVKRLKSEVSGYKQTIEKILNKPIESIVKVEQVANQIQKNTQIVENISSDLQKTLKELLTELQKTKDNKFEGLEKEIEIVLQENNGDFLHKAKGLVENITGFVKAGQKIYHFIPLAEKVISLLHLIP